MEQADEHGRLANVLMRDGQRQEDGFARERACQQLAQQGWLKFLGWIGAPGRGAVWTSCWAVTDAGRRGLARDDVPREEPEWIRSLRGTSTSD